MKFHAFLREHSWSASRLEEVSPDLFIKRGIKALVLDFDGVLAPANALSLRADLSAWIEQSLEQELRIAIHSNNDGLQEDLRKYYIALKHPSVVWMPSSPKKPSPKTILTLSQHWSLSPGEILMIDDRLYTGGKAAYNAGAKFLYIDCPQADYQKSFWTELVYAGIRSWERMTHQRPQRKWCAREDSNL